MRFGDVQDYMGVVRLFFHYVYEIITQLWLSGCLNIYRVERNWNSIYLTSGTHLWFGIRFCLYNIYLFPTEFNPFYKLNFCPLQNWYFPKVGVFSLCPFICTDQVTHHQTQFFSFYGEFLQVFVQLYSSALNKNSFLAPTVIYISSFLNLEHVYVIYTTLLSQSI